jgi:hypothetical protein
MNGIITYSGTCNPMEHFNILHLSVYMKQLHKPILIAFVIVEYYNNVPSHLDWTVLTSTFLNLFHKIEKYIHC